MAPTSILAIWAVVLVAGVNGSPANLRKFPYHVSVKIWNQHYCSGAIISTHHIVTVAHCVAYHSEHVTVVTSTTSHSDGGQVHTPTKIDYHPHYDGEESAFDVAIITLADEIQFNSTQNKISLSNIPTSAGNLATVTEWGSVSETNVTLRPTLSRFQVLTVSINACKELFAGKSSIRVEHICGYSFGVCRGDSGGPLAVNNTLIGVLSWAVECYNGLPYVFTSIYHVLPWINSIMYG